MRPSCARSSNGWAWPRMDGPLEKHAGRGPRRRAFRPRLRGRAAQFSPSAERIEDSSFTGALTLRMPCEIIRHEAIGREAYKGFKGIWTWSISISFLACGNIRDQLRRLFGVRGREGLLVNA